jgi:hypothetical protein
VKPCPSRIFRSHKQCKLDGHAALDNPPVRYIPHQRQICFEKIV